MSRYKIATIVVSILLVVGGIFAVFKITGLSQDYDLLQSRFHTLQSDYTTLEFNFSQLQSDHDELYSEYRSLALSYESLEANYQALHSDYDMLQGRIYELQSSYEELQWQNESLRNLLQEYEKVPNDYYSIGAFPHHSNTYGELTNFLLWEFVLPTGYKTNIFDCSESAAYLEWALENAGFDADIAVGPTPWDSGRHAWVIAHPKGYRVAIEATALTGEYKFLSLFTLRVPGVVYSNDFLVPGWENYYEGYDHLFGNIY